MECLSRNAPVVLLGAALTAAAVMTLVLTAEFTFLQDTWEFLMNRRDPSVDALLTPHNEHIVLFPVLIEELLLRLFGMTTAAPEQVVLVGFLLGTAALLFVYLRRRLGPWLALFGALAVLCLGPAWEVLLWPFEITFVGPMLFGLAMLLALEREDRSGDLAACLFLIAALGFSGLGIPFLAAAAVAVALGGRAAWRRRAFVVVVPALLYLVWYLGWGHDAETHVTLHNVLSSPRFVAEATATAVASLAGLATSPADGSIQPLWGWALLLALVVVLGFRQVRRPGFSRDLWPVAAAAAAYWFLMAFNQIPGREATASRYQYGGAIFVLLILANLLRGVRPSRNTLILVGCLTALAAGPNLVVLKNGRDTFEAQSVLTKSDTAAIEIARRTIDPAFQLSPEVAGTGTLIDIFAGPYLAAVDEYGSPAYSVAELAAAPEEGRHQADVVLARALPLSTVTRLNAYSGDAAGSCTALAAGGEKPEVAVGPGLTRIEVAPGSEASFSLRRFAVGEYPVSTEGAPGGSLTLLRIPADAAPGHPWYLRVEAAQPVQVCG